MTSPAADAPIIQGAATRCCSGSLMCDARPDPAQRARMMSKKVAINDSWDENYGLHGGGSNIPLNLATAASVKFYYSTATHWVTTSVGAASVIATVFGDFQSELGCTGDWQPNCLRSWLQDVDGDGTYTLTINTLPAGSYKCKVAIAEGWTEHYGLGGELYGANIPFTVANTGDPVTFHVSRDVARPHHEHGSGGARALPRGLGTGEGSRGVRTPA